MDLKAGNDCDTRKYQAGIYQIGSSRFTFLPRSKFFVALTFYWKALDSENSIQEVLRDGYTLVGSTLLWAIMHAGGSSPEWIPNNIDLIAPANPEIKLDNVDKVQIIHNRPKSFVAIHSDATCNQCWLSYNAEKGEFILGFTELWNDFAQFDSNQMFTGQIYMYNPEIGRKRSERCAKYVDRFGDQIQFVDYDDEYVSPYEE